MTTLEPQRHPIHRRPRPSSPYSISLGLLTHIQTWEMTKNNTQNTTTKATKKKHTRTVLLYEYCTTYRRDQTYSSSIRVQGRAVIQVPSVLKSQFFCCSTPVCQINQWFPAFPSFLGKYSLLLDSCASFSPTHAVVRKILQPLIANSSTRIGLSTETRTSFFAHIQTKYCSLHWTQKNKRI